MGTGENWTLLHHVSTTGTLRAFRAFRLLGQCADMSWTFSLEYLNYEKGKFSKSRNIGVFGTNVVETGVPAAVWRYYLLSSRPETQDSAFTWEEFISKNNNELLKNIGNLVNRVVKFMDAKYAGVVPEYNLEQPLESGLVKTINGLLQSYITAMDGVKLRLGLKIAMDIGQHGNAYLQEAKIDNTLFEQKRDQCNAVMGAGLNLLYLLAAVLEPFMPTSSECIWRQLNAPARDIPDVWTGNDIKPGHVIGNPEYMYQRIDDKMEETWRSKYGHASK